MHLTLDLYYLLLRGNLALKTYLQLAHEHLRAQCERCGLEWDAFHDEHEEPEFLTAKDAPRPSPSFRPVLTEPKNPCHLSIERLPELKATLSRLRAERRRAREHLALLLDLPPAERRATIARAHSRYRSPALAELLIEASQERVRHEPRQAENLAALVSQVLHRAPEDIDEGLRASLLVRSLAHRANALRVAGDLPTADQCFRNLNQLVHAHALSNPSLLAEVTSLEASLRIEQRHFREAHCLIDDALQRHSEDDPPGRAPLLLQKANLLLHENRPGDALDILRDGIECSSTGNEVLRLSWINAQICALTDLDRFQEASALLEENAPLYEDAGDLRAHGNAAHLRGRIAHGLERHSEARDALTTSRDTYLRHERHYDAAVVALDLARVHLDTGDLDELQSLATDLVRIFAAHGVEREMLAALRLLAQAAQAREVNRDLLTRLRQQLEQARRAPSRSRRAD